MSEFAAAFAKAQAKFGHPTRDRNGQDGNRTFKYADLPANIDAVRPALNANDIGIVQMLDVRDGQHVIRTQLIHKSGESVESVSPIPDGLEVKKLGAYITYLRRYHLAAMCGIASEDDDDAAGLGGVTAPRPRGGPKSKARQQEPPTTGEMSPAMERYIKSMRTLEAGLIAALKHAGRDTNEAPSIIGRIMGDFGVERWEEITAVEVQREAWQRLRDAVTANDDMAPSHDDSEEPGE